MKWNKINSEKDLPPEGKYVLGYYNGDNWIDNDDPRGVYCKVVKLIKGRKAEDIDPWWCT